MRGEVVPVLDTGLLLGLAPVGRERGDRRGTTSRAPSGWRPAPCPWPSRSATISGPRPVPTAIGRRRSSVGPSTVLDLEATFALERPVDVVRGRSGAARDLRRRLRHAGRVTETALELEGAGVGRARRDSSSATSTRSRARLLSWGSPSSPPSPTGSRTCSEICARVADGDAGPRRRVLRSSTPARSSPRARQRPGGDTPTPRGGPGTGAGRGAGRSGARQPPARAGHRRAALRPRGRGDAVSEALAASPRDASAPRRRSGPAAPRDHRPSPELRPCAARADPAERRRPTPRGRTSRRPRPPPRRPPRRRRRPTRPPRRRSRPPRPASRAARARGLDRLDGSCVCRARRWPRSCGSPTSCARTSPATPTPRRPSSTLRRALAAAGADAAHADDDARADRRDLCAARSATSPGRRGQGGRLHASTGERVELDRAVLDALREPLLHLVRNAVDHGIETPRPSARPPASRRRARVRVARRRRGPRSSIDRGRRRARARRSTRCAPTAGGAAALTDARPPTLVFRPACRPPGAVTDVSGPRRRPGRGPRPRRGAARPRDVHARARRAGRRSRSRSR